MGFWRSIILPTFPKTSLAQRLSRHSPKHCTQIHDTYCWWRNLALGWTTYQLVSWISSVNSIIPYWNCPSLAIWPQFFHRFLGAFLRLGFGLAKYATLLCFALGEILSVEHCAKAWMFHVIHWCCMWIWNVLDKTIWLSIWNDSKFWRSTMTGCLKQLLAIHSLHFDLHLVSSW